MGPPPPGHRPLPASPRLPPPASPLSLPDSLRAAPLCPSLRPPFWRLAGSSCCFSSPSSSSPSCSEKKNAGASFASPSPSLYLQKTRKKTKGTRISKFAKQKSVSNQNQIGFLFSKEEEEESVLLVTYLSKCFPRFFLCPLLQTSFVCLSPRTYSCCCESPLIRDKGEYNIVGLAWLGSLSLSLLP